MKNCESPQKKRTGLARHGILSFTLATLSVIVACDNPESPQAQINRLQPPPPSVNSRQSVAALPYPAQTIIAADSAFNQRNMTGAVAHLSSQVLLSEPSSGVPTLRGPDAVKTKFEAFVQYFPDARITPLRILTGPDWVISETKLAGTQTRTLGQNENRNKRFILHGANVHRIQDNSVSEIRVYADAATVVHQLRHERRHANPNLPSDTFDEPNIISEPPNTLLEAKLSQFITAWYNAQEEKLLSLVSKKVSVENHMWHQAGTGTSFLLDQARPTRGLRSVRQIDIRATYSAGDWGAAEIVVTGSTEEPQAREQAIPIRLSHLVVLRFDSERVQEVDLYGNTLSIRTALYGPELFRPKKGAN
tara:strand:+ start:308 stop:1393 length:1086 start_codon:yes stop_codon:yes gene_type:complete